ncbi:MAG: DUF3488 domain-containing protein [Nitrospirae bacterium]|nr:DUF3488 domain-containing protein [Nitrospirota bacterium]
MRFSRAFGMSYRLAALSGLLALALTFEAAYWLIVPAAALVLAGFAYPERLGRPVIPAGAVAALTAAAFLFSIIDFFYIGGSLVMAGADFLVIILCIKLLSLAEEKDYVQLFAVSFFLLLASTGLSTEIYFLAAFFMFFVSLTWSLMLLNVKGESERVAGRQPNWRVGKGFFAGSAFMTLGAAAATLAIFLVIPRVGIGFFSKRAGGLLKTSGFSDTVDLGSMGGVKLDPTTVMRISLSGPGLRPDAPMYWRGRSFDLYSGTGWEDTQGGGQETYQARMGMFYLSGGRPDAARAVIQEVSLEPLDTAVIFGLSPAYAVTGSFRVMRVSPSGVLSLPFAPGSRLHYTVYSTPGPAPEGPKALIPGYLRMPDGSGELARLAAGTTAGAAGPEEKAARIEGYLERNYAYSLDPPRDSRYSPIDDFLFHGKSGYCEHFATAMALMLRASGVPARMVSGFSGGEWNGYGGYYIVRERDAHTWVEALVPGKGWVVYDPTPQSAAQERPSAFSAVSGALDYLKYRWDRYVVYYNIRDQLEGIGALSDAYRSVRDGLSGVSSSIGDSLGMPDTGGLRIKPGRLLLGLAAMFIVAAMAYAVWRVRKGPGGRGRSSVRFYEDMAAALAKRGAVRNPGNTPLEFAGVVEPSDTGRYKGVVYVTRLYNRVRFGGRPLDAAERERVKGVIERIGRE